MQKNRGGGGAQQQQQRRPPQLGDMSGLAAPPGPKSPLSRLVAEGYSQPPAQQALQQQQQPYYSGDKPPSQGSGRSGGGFDAAVAGQWNANVQSDVLNRQSRHDPSIAGPPKPHGGQRVTQPSGGNANIDLSWQQPAPATGSHPPRLPGSGGGAGAAHQYGGGAPGGQHYGGGGAPQGMNYGAQAYARNPSPGPGGASERRSNSSSCPFGREEPTPPPGRQAAPFGMDASPMHPTSMRSGSRGPRGASPSPQQQGYGSYAAAGSPSPHSQHNGEAMAAGGARGRAAGGIRPPGGQSSVVFG